MPKAKEHGLRRGLPPNMAVKLQCEWRSCTEIFANMTQFTSHLTSHLHEELVLKRQPSQATTEQSEGTGLICKWQECHQDLGNDFIDLMRHVYFHAFHTKLKSLGHSFIEFNELETCSLDAMSANMIPELPDRLQCGWKDCDEVSDNPDYFYQHVSSHIHIYKEGNSIPGGATCLWEGCEARTKSKYKLREHLRSHTQEKVMACPTCGALFSNTTKLFDHLQRQIQPTVQTYQCSHCNKRCPTERLLRDHMRHHVNHYKCPFCDMTCPNPSSLRCHIKYRHSSDKPYPCSQCDFRGKSLGDLRRHVVVHTSDNTVFRCHVTGCEFEGKSYFALTIHFKREHQGIGSPTYQCHLCDKNFKRGSSLTVHLKKYHKFKWPSGHRRFRYKLHEDGTHRLQTIRYESIDLTQQLLSDKIRDQAGSADAAGGVAGGGGSDGGSVEGENSAHMRTSTPEPQEEAGSTSMADLSYNLEMLGEVALKLPQGRFSQKMYSGKQNSESMDVEDVISEDAASTHNGDDDNTVATSEVSDMDDFSDMQEVSETGRFSLRGGHAESECGRSEYESVASEIGSHSDYQPSESLYAGSERYAESEFSEPDWSQYQSQFHSRFPSTDSLATGSSLSHAPTPHRRGALDLPPMCGPKAQTVDMATVFETPVLDSRETANLTAAGSDSESTMHSLQPLPTNIEETTQLLAPSH